MNGSGRGVSVTEELRPLTRPRTLKQVFETLGALAKRPEVCCQPTSPSSQHARWLDAWAQQASMSQASVVLEGQGLVELRPGRTI